MSKRTPSMRSSRLKPNAARWQGQVESACARQGLQLTALRRQVLNILAGSAAPLGAYAIIDQLSRREGKPVAPPTVYRTLDFFLERWIRLQDREPQRLCALRAPRPRASRRAAVVREVRTERRDRRREARPSVAGSGRARRLCAASSDGRTRGPMPGLRGLAYEAEKDLRVAHVGRDPGGACIGRICNYRDSLASGTGFASRGMGPCHKERARRPRRRHRLID